MNNTPCPVCNHPETSFTSSYNDYTLLRCSGCDLIFSTPFKNPGSEFYENFYNDLDLHNPARFGVNPSQALFLKRNKLGRLLDVACGMGVFLAAAKKDGFDVTGVDFDKVSLDICRDYFRLEKIYDYDINGEEIKTLGQFDYVTLIDVLEHVDNPIEILKSCSISLKEDGILMISVPNYNRKPNFIFESGDNPPHHLTKWTEKSLRNILEQSGFEVVKCCAMPFTSYELVDYLRAKIYTRFVDMILGKNKTASAKKAQKAHGGDVSAEAKKQKAFQKPSVAVTVLFKIRDLIVATLALILKPFTPALVSILKLEADHLYAEARKK